MEGALLSTPISLDVSPKPGRQSWPSGTPSALGDEDREAGDRRVVRECTQQGRVTHWEPCSNQASPLSPETRGAPTRRAIGAHTSLKRGMGAKESQRKKERRRVLPRRGHDVAPRSSRLASPWDSPKAPVCKALRLLSQPSHCDNETTTRC